MEKKRVFSVVALLSTLFVVPLVFGLGLINTSGLPLLGGIIMTDPPLSPMVLVDPSNVINDAFQAGSEFTVRVNGSEIINLLSRHVKMSWDKNVLNVSEVSYGEFLAGTTSPYGASSSLGNITGVFNDAGYAWIAESVLGEYPGVGGNGSLASFEFIVVGYGSTDLNISLTGPLETGLLDSAGSELTFTPKNGYFSNTIPGDIMGDTVGSPPDGDVDMYDLGEFADAYGSHEGEPEYNELADLMGDTAGSPPDGDVDMYDLGVFADNYGRSI